MSNPQFMPKFCQNCGEKLLEGASFCGNCGLSIVSPASGAIPPETSSTTTTAPQMGWQRTATQHSGVPPYMGMDHRPKSRPNGVTIIGIVQIVLGSFLLLSGLLLGLLMTQSMFDEIVEQDPESYEGITYDDFKVVGYIMLILGPIFIVPAIYLLKGEDWARIATMVILGIFGAISLLAFFIGLSILIAAGAGFSIYYLNKPEIKDHFRKQPDPYLHSLPEQKY
ncbi:MAG: zinc-ribbon domain-containing protein [Candidatus Heimdallarchaeota archaeon]